MPGFLHVKIQVIYLLNRVRNRSYHQLILITYPPSRLLSMYQYLCRQRNRFRILHLQDLPLI